MSNRYLTGMRITNDLHIGNYLGVIPSIKSFTINKNDSIFIFVADLHSLTNGIIQNDPYELIKFFMSSLHGMDNIFYYIQSEFHQISQLSWILTCNTSFGDLKRMTQFKEKNDKNNTNAGYFIYPMLMAADILIPKATHVPVGVDQTQHVEMVRDVAKIMNKKYNTKLIIPEIIVCETAKVMDLRDSTKKMSKSNLNRSGAIFFTDTDDEIHQKIKIAVTDSEMMPHNIIDIKDSRKNIYNLCNIYKAFAENEFMHIENAFGGKRISEFKTSLCELLISKIAPIRKCIKQISNEEVRNILNKHKPFIQFEMEKTMNEVRQIFFNYKKYL